MVAAVGHVNASRTTRRQERLFCCVEIHHRCCGRRRYKTIVNLYISHKMGTNQLKPESRGRGETERVIFTYLDFGVGVTLAWVFLFLSSVKQLWPLFGVLSWRTTRVVQPGRPISMYWGRRLLVLVPMLVPFRVYSVVLLSLKFVLIGKSSSCLTSRFLSMIIIGQSYQTNPRTTGEEREGRKQEFVPF